jgi:hypothetical protein
MAKLTFGQKAIQHVINQGRIEVGIANTIKDASDRMLPYHLNLFF